MMLKSNHRRKLPPILLETVLVAMDAQEGGLKNIAFNLECESTWISCLILLQVCSNNTIAIMTEF